MSGRCDRPLRRLAGRLREMLLLMVGIPDYQRYLAHCRERHPEVPAMSYEQFFRERQASRYGGADGRIGRCC